MAETNGAQSPTALGTSCRTSIKIITSTTVPLATEEQSTTPTGSKEEVVVIVPKPETPTTSEPKPQHQPQLTSSGKAEEPTKSPPSNGVVDQLVGHTHEVSRFYEMTRCVHHIYSLDVSHCFKDVSSVNENQFTSLLSDLEYLQNCAEQAASASASGRQQSSAAAITGRLISLGVIELCQQVVRTLFHQKEFFASKPGSRLRQLTTTTLGLAAQLTDGSTDACRRVLEIGFQKDLWEYLRSELLDPVKVKYDKWRGYIADCFLALLYNVIQVVTEARELYRDENAVRVLQRFRTRTTTSVSCMALILQAYVVNEDENSLLIGNDDTCFVFLSDELKSTFDDPDEHRSSNGYRAIELVTAINKLAVTDVNKPKIVSSGVVDSYLRLIKGGRCAAAGTATTALGTVLADSTWFSNIDEQRAAAEGLWTLASSKCVDQLRHHNGLVDELKAQLNAALDDTFKRRLNGALDALAKPVTRENSPNPSEQMNQSMSSSVDGALYGDQVFISYNHASKATVLRLRDRLKAAGFRVWVDEEGVFESIADDIIKGLDRASVVLACMTQKYYESPYCKKEVIYAAESYKKIIPLTLEPRYNPHGWLRFHTSDGLRYDFSNDENFEDSFRKLAQTLRIVLSENKTPDVSQQVNPVSPFERHDHQSSLSPMPCTPSLVMPLLSMVSSSSSNGSKPVKSWTSKEVINWMHANGIHHLAKWFQGFDGDMLLEYKAFRSGSPETQAACYHDERKYGKMTVADVMKLTRALKRL